MKTATLQDLPLFRRYLLQAPRRLCLYAPGLLFMWRDYLRLAFREEEETLTVRLAYDGGSDTYLYPIGRAPEAALDRLIRAHGQSGTPLTLLVTEEEKAKLLAAFPTATATSDRAEADYLYDTAALATFPGRRYGGQRNHLNRFARLYPEATVEAITEENACTLLPFLNEFAARQDDRPLLWEELSMTREVLTHFSEYGMDGVLVRIGERIAAFACGEVIGDTLSVHIEKADTRLSGSYQRIVSAFASRYDPTRVPYLNREDDMGDEGLRTSKLSYHPTAILDKWRVTLPI